LDDEVSPISDRTPKSGDRRHVTDPLPFLQVFNDPIRLPVIALSDSPTDAPATMTDTIPPESPSKIPENLSSSIILSSLPQDATTALTIASTTPKTKRPSRSHYPQPLFICRILIAVTVRFKAVGRAPILVESKQRGQITSDQKFGTLSNHLRRQLKLKSTESLVTNAFQHTFTHNLKNDELTR
jgi:hypothetical protein